MDLYLPDKEVLVTWLLHYGDIALFGLLVLGIIALPVPEETLMVLAGILIDHGHLSVIPTMLAAYAGSMCGITISYLVGRVAGQYCIVRYGGWLGLTEARLKRVQRWFERFGKWTLVFGYFIPGIRHFTGLSAGATGLSYRSFALFAYTGALLWVSTFVAIGYFFGNYWLSAFENIEISIDEILVVLILAAVFLYAVIKYIRYRWDSWFSEY